jgi:DNA helicase-2/ATP-dependent DNA helicase PcrA
MIEPQLNPEQREAVEYDDGHLLVLAGAGSGKTRVLTSKIVHLLRTGTVKPGNVLAMTFTNKAAAEMEGRVASMLAATRLPRMGTFHSVCLWMLRREAPRLGLLDSFSIYDRDDQKSLVRKILRDMGQPPGVTVSAALSWISTVKSDDSEDGPSGEGAGNPWRETMTEVHQAYRRALEENGALDFDDLLTYTRRALCQNADIGDYYRSRFTRILVDEYQDTNLVQHRILRALAGEDARVTVVGDDDQAIYGWRGARVSNILEFPSDFPGTRIIRLETNYRSTGGILRAAGTLVANNRSRHGKTLKPVNEEGEPVEVVPAATPTHEARWIVDSAEDFRASGIPLERIAVLYRTNAQSRELEAACRLGDVRYEVVGAQRFFEREEIKDLVSYLRVVVNPGDGESMSRIINKPARGVGEKSAAVFFGQARSRGLDYISALASATRMPGINPRGAAALERLGETLGKASEMVARGDPAGEIVDMVLLETGLAEQYGSGDVTDQARLENLEEFRRFAAQYDLERPRGGLTGFLMEQSLMTTQDSYSGQGLALMTLHCAKGLEFDVVFIAGLEEGLLPHIRRGERGPGDLEEERRLLYVGMTRARKRLFLTTCASRAARGGFGGGPSRFLAEIAPALPRRDSPPAAMPGDPPPEEDFRRGEIIGHPRYGRGMILSARRRSGEWELTIDFGFDEPKTILTGYVPIQRYGDGVNKINKQW